MSCYEWEEGTIKLPSKVWASFRTNLLKAWNAHYLSNLETAKKAHKELSDAIKGKRGKKREEALKAAVKKRFSRREYCRLHRRTVDRDVDTEIRRMVVEERGWGENATITLKALPKKKDLPLKATSKDAEMDFGDTYVKFVNKTKSVVWSVSENNRARERAHEHWFAKKLFAALDKVEWTRGSGGKIIGNDEYNRDAGREYEGGGGSYVTREYSQEKQKRDREARRRARYSPMGGYYPRYY
jgi:hypothetical protein